MATLDEPRRVVRVRLPDDLIARLERFAGLERRDRNDAVEYLLAVALEMHRDSLAVYAARDRARRSGEEREAAAEATGKVAGDPSGGAGGAG